MLKRLSLNSTNNADNRYAFYGLAYASDIIGVD